MKRYSIILASATAVAMLSGCAYDDGFYRDRTNSRLYNGAYAEPREYGTQEQVERWNYVERVRDDPDTEGWIASCAALSLVRSRKRNLSRIRRLSA
jgi:hypothetical protein